MKPDFLGIGAPRSATSWLHRMLAAHPQLWLPPVKEIHWFDVQRPASRPLYPVPGADPAAIARRFRRDHQRLLLRSLARSLRRGTLTRRELAWTARYLGGRRSDEWYASLFPRGRIAGEITPAYMFLPRPIVEAASRGSPGLRVLLLLRDPVDRLWSGARRFALGPGGFGEENRRRVLAHVDAPGVRLRTDYVGALEVWRSVLGRERVFVGFYDDVAERPAALLQRALRFLGADPDAPGFAPDLERRPNAGRELEIPPEIAALLAQRCLPALRTLAREFEGPPTRWLARAEALAAG